ncbi:SIMPL domain-containing protein [Porticoccaceae bacterium LTM1]|nr:SIMPL domain-containing protein [Porticoccaceae bacterium LTM1]
MKIITSLFLIICTINSYATEMRGTPEELKNHFYPETPKITLYGNADRTVESDIAKIAIIIRTEAKKMEQALTENTEIRQKVITTLSQAGIPQKDIQTDNFSTSPEFGIFSSRPSSFSSINTIKVSVTTSSQFEAVALLVDIHPEISLGKIEYELSNKAEIKRQLLAEALADVMSKKAIYEKELGIILKVVGINSYNDSHRARRYDEVEEIVLTGSRMLGSESSKTRHDEPLKFGEMTFYANSAIFFEILDK